MKRFFLPLALLTSLVAIALGTFPAEAHGTAAGGALAGLAHPLLGVDHLLMLLAVGTAASQISLLLLPWALGGGVLGALFGNSLHTMPILEILAALAIVAVAALTLQAGGARFNDRVFPMLSAWAVSIGMAIHGLLHAMEAPSAGIDQLWWWAGALLSSGVICIGTALVLRLLPQAWGRLMGLALLMAGGLLVFAIV